MDFWLWRSGRMPPIRNALEAFLSQRWPNRLWIARHGESAGNVARDAALSSGREWIDIKDRDIDVPLSDLGERQARALGRWFASLPDHERPDVILTSPYARASGTAELVATELRKFEGGLVSDERLREKEFGQLDRLTRIGIEKHFPLEAEARSRVGKFYYRPPSGESWCDVILRLRSVLDTISLHHGGKNVLIVAHQVVVLCMRYLLENLDEDRILAIDAEGDVVNCGLTEYIFRPTSHGSGDLQLHRYNFAAPLEEQGAAITAEPDTNAPAK